MKVGSTWARRICKIVACVEDNWLSNKQVYVQIEYLSRVHTKGNFEKVPGHNFFKLSLMIHTSI